MDNFVLTMDLDWAADFMIDAAAQVLIDAGVKATIFVTHDSPAVRRLRQYPDLFELGLHPNFLPNSSHGKTIDEVLDFCLDLVPNATAMRTHALVQSGHILAKAVQRTSVEVDVSLLLPDMPHIQIVELPLPQRSLLRLPYYWEDDLEAIRHHSVWTLDKHVSVPGIKVFDFHPVFIYLNSAELTPYEKMKQLGHLPDLTPEEVAPFVNQGEGTATMFRELVDHLAERESYCVCDMVELHKAGVR